MKEKQIVSYGEAFKRQVVDQIERGEFTGTTQASRVYGINGATTVRGWLRKYGSGKLLPKQVKIMSQNEIDETQQLKKRVRELEKALADTHMRGLLSESYLEIACENMGVDPELFKKKHATDLSGDQRKNSQR
jgi:transposase-like protein